MPLMNIPLESGITFTGTPKKIRSLHKSSSLRQAILAQIVLGPPKALEAPGADLPGCRPS